jgi:hypothetical protein
MIRRVCVGHGAADSFRHDVVRANFIETRRRRSRTRRTISRSSDKCAACVVVSLAKRRSGADESSRTNESSVGLRTELMPREKNFIVAEWWSVRFWER